MQDAPDFSLPIVVVLPERRVVADEQASTTPFVRAALPGVDLRPAVERAATAGSRSRPAAAEAGPRPSAPSAGSRPAAPLSAPHHARLPSPSPSHPVPSRLRARSLLGVPPPPPTRAAPLSDDDEQRMLRRTRAYRRIAWAQRLLERFGFDPPAAHG